MQRAITKTAKVTKRVEYSYPTSPNAERFGFRGGCYCVELVTNDRPRAVAAFERIEEAKANAEKMPVPWDRFTK